MWLLWLGSSAIAADIVVDVGDDWCAALTTAVAGDRVLLAAGTHEGVCTLTSVGESGAPVTLGVVDPELGAILTTDETTVNLLDVDGSWLVVESVELGPTPTNVDAIRWRGGESLTIREVTFTGVGGQAVVANSAGVTYDGLVIEDSVFTDITGGAISVGCQAGERHCAVSAVRVRGNRIARVADGPGVAFEMDVSGTVVGNSISATSGPAIVVGGDALADGTGVEAPADVASPAVVVESNHVSGSGDAAVRVEGGPALVRNNLVVAGSGGGIHAAGAGRMDHVHILGNTVSGGSGPPVLLEDWVDTASLSFQNNAVWDPSAPGAGVPTAVGTLPWGGNVACSTETSCFEDLAGGDPSPREGGELADQAVEVADGLLEDDACGQARTAPGVAGMLGSALAEALDLTVDLDPRVHCTPGDPGDTGDTGDTGETSPGPDVITRPDDTDSPDPDEEGPDLPQVSVADLVAEQGGVTCASAGAAAGWLGLLSLLVVAGRREE